ncbi:MAG: hypothetical protein WBW84_01535 [Acidobacteriaceae bacterium]
MKSLLLVALIFIGQMNSLQDRPVVHLAPNRNFISVDFGGKLLELTNSPATISLPADPPRLDSNGRQWSIDVRNFGPANVTVVGRPRFNIPISVGETVHIVWNGTVFVRR